MIKKGDKVRVTRKPTEEDLVDVGPDRVHLKNANSSQGFHLIEKNDPIFEILFRDGNWGAHDYQLTDMMREVVIRYNKIAEYLNTRLQDN